jgi:hypothetical protein
MKALENAAPNLRITFSEAFLELGHFESHSSYICHYH